MTDLDILLPFGLPAPDTASALIRECQTPALARLLARSSIEREAHDPLARALTHENWLARRFDLQNDTAIACDHSPKVALAAMRALNLTPAEGCWFMLHPGHIQIASNQLILSDMRQLALTPNDARALFDAAASLFAEAGKTLVYGSADTWFVRADDWRALRCATPDAASGHNIDRWMPQGEGERAWRKLQNEVQMQWFTEAVNQQREARGQASVNALWLWGAADQPSVPTKAQHSDDYQVIFNLSDWLQVFGQFAERAPQNCQVAQVIADPATRGLLLLDGLSAAGLNQEWGEWLQAIEMLERDWFAPLHAALRDGKLRRLRLILCGQEQVLTSSSTHGTLRKFWITATLAALAKCVPK